MMQSERPSEEFPQGHPKTVNAPTPMAGAGAFGPASREQIDKSCRHSGTLERDNISILLTWLKRVLVQNHTAVTLRLLRRRVEMDLPSR